MHGIPTIKNWAGIAASVNRYVDNLKCAAATGTWTFTNASTAVESAGHDGNAVVELVVGDRVYLDGDASGPGANGANWGTVQTITDASHIVLAAVYTGTGGSGTMRYSANTGLTQNDAWISMETAVTDTTSSRVVAVRRGQTHTISAQRNIGGNGSSIAPIILIGDNDTLEIWSADAGDTRPIYDIKTNAYYIDCGSSSRFVLFANLHFKGDDDEQALSAYLSMVYCHNCTFANCRIVGSSSFYYSCILNECDLDITGTANANITVSFGTHRFRNCTFDGGKYGINVSGISSVVFIENCSLGVGTAHSTSDIYGSGMGFPILTRDVIFGSGTEVSFGTESYPNFHQQIAHEDYDGTKGAWKVNSVSKVGGVFDPLTSIASAATVAGARAGGAVTVIKALLAANRYPTFCLPISEIAFNCTSTGTAVVDVWTQPNGWAAVPDTLGVNANVWVEVAAWDTATSKYLYFDSRDEGAQDAQVNDEWHKIRVSGVAVDSVGTIIVRVYQSYGDGTDILYVDRIIDVAIT